MKERYIRPELIVRDFYLKQYIVNSSYAPAKSRNDYVETYEESIWDNEKSIWDNDL